MGDAAIKNKKVSLTAGRIRSAMVEDSDESRCVSSRKDEDKKWCTEEMRKRGKDRETMGDSKYNSFNIRQPKAI